MCIMKHYICKSHAITCSPLKMYMKYQRYTKTKVAFAFTSGYLQLRLLKLVFCNYIFPHKARAHSWTGSI